MRTDQMGARHRAVVAIISTAFAAWAARPADAQTSRGIGADFEVLGRLYSGSGALVKPPFLPAGDGWAQGATLLGVLDANGQPTIDPISGTIFRAMHTVDPNWGNQGNGSDPTLFGGGNKNDDLIGSGQNPWEWTTGSGGPQKNDITNSYFHTRIDPATGDRWVFVGAETRSINGDSHVDFEFNQTGVELVGGTSGSVVGLGPHGGRTVNDFLISVDFEQGGENPVGSVRFWNGSNYVLAATPGAILSATNLIDIPHGAGGTWKHFASNGAMVNLLTHLQLVEAGVNLTALGIDVDPCSTDATFIVKSRSSSSFTSDLKDFVVTPFPLEPAPVPALFAPQEVCPGTTFEVSAVEMLGLPDAVYAWEIAGPGAIISNPFEPTIMVQADDDACDDQIVLIVHIAAGLCQDLPVTEQIVVEVRDVEPPVLNGVPANATVQCDNVPPPASVTASDACTDATVSFSQTQTPGACPAERTIVRTWTAIDACGNMTTQSQTLHVVDTSAPQLQINPDDQQVFICDSPTTLTINASDNCGQIASMTHSVDADVPRRVTVQQISPSSLRVTLTGPVIATITVTATDECGNSTGSVNFQITAECGDEACSPGFWRNHFDAWCPTGFNPTANYCFVGPATLFVNAFQLTDLSAAPAGLNPNMTLLQAVNSSGGVFNQALFQGSAALLNALSPDLEYPGTVAEIRQTMQMAFSGAITFSQAVSVFNQHNAAEAECGCPLSTIPPPPPVGIEGCEEEIACAADVNHDGTVNGIDLGILLSEWGPNIGHPADINADGWVDGFDLGMLLGSWGFCD